MSTPEKILKAIAKVGKKHILEYPTKLGWGGYNGSALVTAQQWEDNGNGYAHETLVAVAVHESWNFGKLFSLDACYRTGAASEYDPYEDMQDALAEIGLWSEQINTYSTAIYRMD